MASTGTWKTYAKFIQHVLKADIDFDTVTFKAMIVDSTYTPDPDADEFVSLIRAKEVTGTNWAADGQVTTPTVSINAASNKVEVAFSDISVATVTLTDGKYLVVYNDTPGTDATRHLIGYVTFDVALAPTAGTLAYDFPIPTFSFDY